VRRIFEVVFGAAVIGRSWHSWKYRDYLNARSYLSTTLHRTASPVKVPHCYCFGEDRNP